MEPPPSLLDRVAATAERHFKAGAPAPEKLRVLAPSTVTVGSALEEGIAKLRLEAEQRSLLAKGAPRTRQLPPPPDADQLAETAARHEHAQDKAWAEYIAEANAPSRSR